MQDGNADCVGHLHSNRGVEVNIKNEVCWSIVTLTSYTHVSELSCNMPYMHAYINRVCSEN